MSDPKVAAVKVSVLGDSAIACGTGNSEIIAQSRAFREAGEKALYQKFVKKYGSAAGYKGVAVTLMKGDEAAKACQAEKSRQSLAIQASAPVVSRPVPADAVIAANGQVLYK